MAYLNSRALEAVANALRDAASTYGKLAENDALPERLQRDFHAQRHMADVLADLFEQHPAMDAEGVKQEDYRAMIWEHLNISKSPA